MKKILAYSGFIAAAILGSSTAAMAGGGVHVGVGIGLPVITAAPVYAPAVPVYAPPPPYAYGAPRPYWRHHGPRYWHHARHYHRWHDGDAPYRSYARERYRNYYDD